MSSSSSLRAEEEYLKARNAEVRAERSSDGAGASSALEGDGTLAGKAADEEPLDESLSAEAAAELKAAGNAAFQRGEDDLALEKYASALRSAHLASHDRAVLFANRAAVHVRREHWREAVEDASRAIDIEADYNKALVRRKKAAEKLEDWATAAKDAKALECPAAEIAALEYRAKQKAERETAEAMAQLKGLGNSILSNFGLSLDSFKVNQDPETGGYNIQMRQ